LKILLTFAVIITTERTSRQRFHPLERALTGEVTVRLPAISVADQTIGVDERRIELNLDLHVLRDRDERRAGLINQHAARFRERIDIGIIAVPSINEFFEPCVVQVSATESEYTQEDAALPFRLNQIHQLGSARDTDIEVAVGRGDIRISTALAVGSSQSPTCEDDRRQSVPGRGRDPKCGSPDGNRAALTPHQRAGTLRGDHGGGRSSVG
jgi:hypothetical protein